MKKLILMISSGFGLGYSPFASGTCGALLGVPLGLAMTVLHGHLALQLAFAAVLVLLAIPVCDAAEKIYGVKDETGARVEFLLLKQISGNRWETLCKPGKKAREGARFSFGDGLLRAEVAEVKDDGNRIVDFDCDESFFATLDKTGPDDKPIPLEDNAVCLYRLEGGIVGTMTASWTYYGEEDNSTVIYGTEGILRIYDRPGIPMQWIHKDGQVENMDVETIQTNDNQTRSGIADALVGALETRDEGPLSAATVLPAMKAVFAALKSSEEGRFIEI